MDYVTLQKLYYSDPAAYESTYQQRLHSEYAHPVPFSIGEFPAFFLVTPEIGRRMLSIQKADKRVLAICNVLPQKAIQQFSSRCLIDEIVLTNNIEGVHSTRREIDSILSGLARQDRNCRFKGLVQKYEMLQSKAELPLENCQDVRRIYDELVLAEVGEDDPANLPDGRIFRKGPVSVYSPAQKEIHTGLFPEERIIAAMTQALDFLRDDGEELLYRTAVFHYLLGYIHPFYDGNGRLNRFISSYMLTKELQPVVAYRLSYTIKENIEKYYQAFKVCNHPLNRGDLTPFVELFLEIIETSVLLLAQALEKRQEQLEHYAQQVQFLPGGEDGSYQNLYGLLIQAALFSEHGISTRELLWYLDVSRATLRKKLEVVKKAGLLKTEQIKKEKCYGIDLDLLDKFIVWKAGRGEH